MTDPFIEKTLRDGASGVDLDLISENYRNISSVGALSDICAREADGRHMHVLLEGWACKYRLMNDGRRQILSIHLPGEICDLDRICCDAGFGVLALTECRVATVSLDWLRRTMAERPQLRETFMMLLTRESLAAAEHVVSLGRRSARERAAYLLCDLLSRLQALGTALDNSFRLPLTQVDMGDHLGLSTVHVNRTLQDLKSERLIQSGGRTYKICNREGLERLAHFCRPAKAGLRVEMMQPAAQQRAFADARN